jgi:hypothetical protein
MGQAKPIKNKDLYEDKDGKSTKESIASYLTKTAFTLIFIRVALGLAALFAHLVSGFVHISKVREPRLILTLFGYWVYNYLL